MEEQHVKTAILLLNMGGPESPEEVHPYMKELFQDRELLKLPAQK
ncbi:MAG: ferrochelatase, partial [Akkermansiaceae bacterium]